MASLFFPGCYPVVENPGIRFTKVFQIPLISTIFVSVKNTIMATVTIKIDTKSKKAKYLVDPITELSKSDKGITVVEEKSEFMKSIDQSFDELEQLKKGKLKPKPVRELLDEL
jgi:16S rRNA G1207 methylase RsmC